MGYSHWSNPCQFAWNWNPRQFGYCSLLMHWVLFVKVVLSTYQWPSSCYSSLLVKQSSRYTFAHSSRQDAKLSSGKSRRRDEEGYVLTPVDMFLCACLCFDVSVVPLKRFIFVLRWHGSIVLFKPLPHAHHVIAHRTRPTFISNSSVLNYMEADGKGAVGNVGCVKHCVHHHWTSAKFPRQYSGGEASFVLCSVCSDFVIVLEQNKFVSTCYPINISV